MRAYFQAILLIVFSILYLFPRLIPLKQQLEFRSDQGVHLLETKTMVDDRDIRLLGPVTSKTYDGRHFFTGATYYYFLALLGITTNWSPLLITSSTIIFEYILYLFFIRYIQKKFGYYPAIVISFVISLVPYLIFHSFFFWNPHFLIPLSIIFLLSRKNPYLSALIFGLAFSFHYSAIFWLIPYIIFRFRHNQLSLGILLKAILAFSIANLPIILFEFRHQFYNLKTMLLVIKAGSETFSITPHYFVFPLIILVLYFLLHLSQKYHFPLYLFFLLMFLLKDSAVDLGQRGWNYQNQQKVVNYIKKDCPTNFNIASSLTGDTRAYDLRFLFKTLGCQPGEVITYPNSSTIFFVSSPSRPPETEKVWEIDSFKPFQVTNREIINDNVVLYRLDKTFVNP